MGIVSKRRRETTIHSVQTETAALAWGCATQAQRRSPVQFVHIGVCIHHNKPKNTAQDLKSTKMASHGFCEST